jgi:TonB family protein
MSGTTVYSVAQPQTHTADVQADKAFEAPMHPYLHDSLLEHERPWRLTSAGASVLAHGVVVALLLAVSGPVWQSTAVRPVTRLAAPVTVTESRRRPVVRVKDRRLTARLPTPSAVAVARVAVELAVPRSRPISAPVAIARPVVRIEAPAEASPVTVMPMPMPTVATPVLAVKPVVRVGLLENSGAAEITKRRSTGAAGFDGVDADSGAAGMGRRLARAGFDDGEAGSGVAAKRTVARGGFDAVEAPAAKPVATRAGPAVFTGIEILEKPRPTYTEEARRLRIEGTVQLRVVFGAEGQLRVVSVVKGLGHGLDEAAVRAAEAIRFRPARRDGHPVDAPAVIQILFQIA